ncbi:MAG: adenylate/guanylate cyclase domain-containing protein [Simkaniaceae bacterium]|nr:adenylate/guanylate cyclase domain-containing protein [Simkaniaceae bacterium]MCF7851989.1 adenylate/guanylate cyclase domain-containing protein [Simkaniaceae bacterium]
MQLRTKIYVLIGGLFFFAFVAAQFLEEIITSRSLELQSSEIHQEIIKNEELKRLEIQSYIQSEIDDCFDRLYVILNQVKQAPLLYRHFLPLQDGRLNQTWFAAASLLNQNKWLDWIENKSASGIASLITVDPLKPTIGVELEKSENFSVVAIQNDPSPPSIYLAIPYTLSFMPMDQDNVGGRFFLFTPEQIRQLDMDAMVKKTEMQSVPYMKRGLEELINHLRQTKQALIAGRLFNGEKGDQIQDKECQTLLSQDKQFNNIDRYMLRYLEIAIVRDMALFLSTNLLGDDPMEALFPKGMVQIQSNGSCGYAVLNQDVFSDSMRSTLTRTSIFLHGDGQTEFPKTVSSDGEGRIFFGRTMRLESTQNPDLNSSLSVAIDAQSLVKNIALATAADIYFCSSNHVIKGFSRQGIELIGPKLNLPFDELKGKTTGFIPFEGGDYFFMKITPYSELDIDFYLLTPQYREFSLAMSIQKSAKNLIHKISHQMQVIAFIALILVFFFLNKIAKHMTDPISHLANACRVLRHGHLSEVHLPTLKGDSKDEVHTLYRVFDEMIDGLKEKDKVQGVLNKVVSPEIAKEILTGTIHLGGEEKNVTVMFADIRNFTKMSENMEPHDVINMLNTCMTKISHAIDQHSGVIDKFVGDEVMALFGAPINDEEGAKKAVICAFEILKVLDEWNAERKNQNLVPVEMGIGIHTGLVVAGNMGAENRLNYTVLGANVNLAARLCSAAKPHEILISRGTLESPGVKQSFETQALEKMSLKGFSEPVEVFLITHAQS